MTVRSVFKGAALVSGLMVEDDAAASGHLLNAVLERIPSEQSFPALDEYLYPDYVDVATTILMNEEMTTWRNMLAFNLGVWWMLGFVKDSHKVPGFGIFGGNSVVKQVKTYMLDLARRGTFLDYAG